MKAIALIIGLLTGISALSQSPLTTVILVRHAEKSTDNPKDPSLSPEGLERAARLAKLLQTEKIVAVYSTHTKRTESTVKEIANSRGLLIENYDASKTDYLDTILQKYAGGTVIICGHSNTVPGAANYLLGNNDLKNFTDSDYDNLLVVTVLEKGKGKLVWLKF